MGVCSALQRRQEQEAASQLDARWDVWPGWRTTGWDSWGGSPVGGGVRRVNSDLVQQQRTDNLDISVNFTRSDCCFFSRKVGLVCPFTGQLVTRGLSSTKTEQLEQNRTEQNRRSATRPTAALNISTTGTVHFNTYFGTGGGTVAFSGWSLCL